MRRGELHLRGAGRVSRPQVRWGAARRCGGGNYISGVQAGCVEAIGEVGRKYKGQGLGQD